MADTRQFEELVRQLLAVRSPGERLRLLSRAWRSLRRMDRTTRGELARRIGLQNAEGVIDKLARDRGRLSPSMLMDVIERAREVGIDGFRDVARSMRDPEQREVLIRRGLDIVEDQLSAPAPGTDDPVPHQPAEPEPAPIPLSEAAVPAPPAETAGPAPAAAAEPVIEPPRPVASPPAEPVVEPAPPEPMPHRAAVVAAATLLPSAPLPVRDEAVRPAQPLPVSETPALAERLEAQPTSLRRLRLLRSNLGQARTLDADQLKRVLQAFAADWSRRRALSALLLAGIPADTSRALELIVGLESPGARRWCAADLLRERDLDPADRREIAERLGVLDTRFRALARYANR